MRHVIRFSFFLLLNLTINQVSSIAQLIEAARGQINVTNEYDPAYYALEYPGGDIDRSKGVCIDVIIRGLRDAYDYDLQEEVITYMRRYPNQFNERPDKNISHRRVKNVRVFMDNDNHFIKISRTMNEKEGDILIWDLGNGLLHIGFVSENNKIIHNISSGVKEEYPSTYWTLLDHFRFNPPE